MGTLARCGAEDELDAFPDLPLGRGERKVAGRVRPEGKREPGADELLGHP
jgi:hypothetical protein